MVEYFKSFSLNAKATHLNLCVCCFCKFVFSRKLPKFHEKSLKVFTMGQKTKILVILAFIMFLDLILYEGQLTFKLQDKLRQVGEFCSEPEHDYMSFFNKFFKTKEIIFEEPKPWYQEYAEKAQKKFECFYEKWSSMSQT